MNFSTGFSLGKDSVGIYGFLLLVAIKDTSMPLYRWMSYQDHFMNIIMNINETASLVSPLRLPCSDLDIYCIGSWSGYGLGACYIHRQ